MFHIAMAMHSLKLLLTNRVLKIIDDVISQSISTKFCVFVCYTKRHLCAKSDKKQRSCKKWERRHSKNSSAILVCDYFLLIPIDVPSFKLIEGQIKELQGVVPNTPWAENDQKSPSRIGLMTF